jgi:hypothetical protein
VREADDLLGWQKGISDFDRYGGMMNNMDLRDAESFLTEFNRPKTLEELCAVLNQFNSDFPRPEMGVLHLSNIAKVTEARGRYPNHDKPGVYVFLNANRQLTYVGKATYDETIGTRLRKHYYADGRPMSSYAQDAVFVASIPFPKDRSFEGAALEEYLILRLSPPRNRLGRNPALNRALRNA